MANDPVSSESKRGDRNPVKRRLLNVFGSGTLKIKTREVQIGSLQALERRQIEFYAPAKKLRNAEHTPNTDSQTPGFSRLGLLNSKN